MGYFSFGLSRSTLQQLGPYGALWYRTLSASKYTRSSSSFEVAFGVCIRLGYVRFSLGLCFCHRLLPPLSVLRFLTQSRVRRRSRRRYSRRSGHGPRTHYRVISILGSRYGLLQSYSYLSQGVSNGREYHSVFSRYSNGYGGHSKYSSESYNQSRCFPRSFYVWRTRYPSYVSRVRVSLFRDDANVSMRRQG